MHQEEAITTQLGWFFDELPSYTVNLKKNIKKRGKKYIQDGGLDQNPQNKKEKG